MHVRRSAWPLLLLLLSGIAAGCGGGSVSEPAPAKFPTNLPPVANAGPAQSLRLGSIVTLDASASSDADSPSLRYQWEFRQQPSASQARLSAEAAASVRPRFTADVAGAYEVALTVTDGLSVATSNVTINVLPESGALPVAQAPRDFYVADHQGVSFRGWAVSAAPTDASWTIVDPPIGSFYWGRRGVTRGEVMTLIANSPVLRAQFVVRDATDASKVASAITTVTAVDVSGTWTGPLGLAGGSPTGKITFSSDSIGRVTGAVEAIFTACGEMVRREALLSSPIYPLSRRVLDAEPNKSFRFPETDADATLVAELPTPDRMTGTLSVSLPETSTCSRQVLQLPWSVSKV